MEAWIWRNVVTSAIRVRARASRARARSVEHELSVDTVARDGRPEDDAEIRAAIRRLPERQRLVLFLRYYADLDYETIGAVPATAILRDRWFLGGGAPHPTGPVVTVATGSAAGVPWTLTAYRTRRNGICVALAPRAAQGASGGASQWRTDPNWHVARSSRAWRVGSVLRRRASRTGDCVLRRCARCVQRASGAEGHPAPHGPAQKGVIERLTLDNQKVGREALR